EIHRQAGVSMTDRLALPRDPVVPGAVTVGLDVPRAALYRRIDRRVDLMWERGLVAEIAALKDRLGSGRYPVQQAIGYLQIVGYLEGLYPEEEAKRLVKRDSRRFARRQSRQFLAFPGIRWLQCPDPAEAERLVDEAARAYLEAGAAPGEQVPTGSGSARA
ncbi:MAG: tRNA (adenosine(37)-N6)-dimethylallyltransferase MiaA, partial [Candidatus Riflebacteria bacterium]|nr:tRNA (adenosine(37)-N6)-dimethylallyltransferase MiaA [Candidatus Riflebacteria bacterium]